MSDYCQRLVSTCSLLAGWCFQQTKTKHNKVKAKMWIKKEGKIKQNNTLKVHNLNNACHTLKWPVLSETVY